jgi:hypothetical protein
MTTATDQATVVKVTPQQSVSGVLDSFKEFVGDYGPSYRFYVETEEGLVTFVEKKEKADEQFAKLSVSIEQAVGLSYRFWKKPTEPGSTKGYFNISEWSPGRPRASTNVPRPAPKPVRRDPPLPPELQEFGEGQDKAASARRSYAENLDWVLKNVVPKLTELQIPCDLPGVNSAVATLMIQASK